MPEQVSAQSCPCGHPLDADGDPDDYACIGGVMYGPCTSDDCGGICESCDDCKSLPGCCDTG